VPPVTAPVEEELVPPVTAPVEEELVPPVTAPVEEEVDISQSDILDIIDRFVMPLKIFKEVYPRGKDAHVLAPLKELNFASWKKCGVCNSKYTPQMCASCYLFKGYRRLHAFPVCAEKCRMQSAHEFNHSQIHLPTHADDACNVPMAATQPEKEPLISKSDIWDIIERFVMRKDVFIKVYTLGRKHHRYFPISSVDLGGRRQCSVCEHHVTSQMCASCFLFKGRRLGTLFPVCNERRMNNKRVRHLDCEEKHQST